MSNSYYSSTTTVVARKRLIITSHVHCLSFSPLVHFQITSLVNTKMVLKKYSSYCKHKYRTTCDFLSHYIVRSVDRVVCPDPDSFS